MVNARSRRVKRPARNTACRESGFRKARVARTERNPAKSTNDSTHFLRSPVRGGHAQSTRTRETRRVTSLVVLGSYTYLTLWYGSGQSALAMPTPQTARVHVQPRPRQGGSAENWAPTSRARSVSSWATADTRSRKSRSGVGGPRAAPRLSMTRRTVNRALNAKGQVLRASQMHSAIGHGDSQMIPMVGCSSMPDTQMILMGDVLAPSEGEG